MRIAFDPTASDADRDQLAGGQFAGLYLGEPRRGPKRGGRTEAQRILNEYDAARYGKSRNFLNAPVSELSGYLRHGMVFNVEVRDALRERYRSQPQLVEEFLKQLTWRDFFEKALAWYGPEFQRDVEPAKHHVPRRIGLPADVAAGQTGLPCMDAIVDRLVTEGYLHNHERLWFAAYLCHFRGVHWSEGARLFRQHLYCGDYASNTASWQWVESTFANKPYFMNQENIARYSDNKWCRDCRVNCPFRASYEQLEVRLFQSAQAPLAANTGGEARSPEPAAAFDPTRLPKVDSPERAETLVWVHDAAISAAEPAVAGHPDAAIVYVFDQETLSREPMNFHRIAFILDGLADLMATVPNPVLQVRIGSLATEVAAAAAELGATTVALSDGAFPGVRETLVSLRARHKVAVYDRPQLTQYSDEPKRFMRFWDKVAKQSLGYQPRR